MSEDSSREEAQDVEPLDVDPLVVVQVQLDGAEKAAEDMLTFLLDVAHQLRTAFDDTVGAHTSVPKQGFEKWVAEWHSAVAKTLYLLRRRADHEVVGSSRIGDWLCSEKLLGFLVAERFLPTLDKSDPCAQRLACHFEQLPADLARALLKYLSSLTVHEFVSIKAYFASTSSPESCDDQLSNYYVALKWIDRLLLSWISSRCPYPNGCKLLEYAPNRTGSPLGPRFAADHLADLASRWERSATQGSNPLDELRPASETMLDVALTCRCVHDAFTESDRETSRKETS